jgi:putative hemolysin
MELAGEPNDFLSTVQIGITLIGILAGAVGGANIAEQLKLKLSSIPALAPYSEAIGIGVVVLIITYLSLVIGELLPKRLALNNAEGIASIMARPMRMLSKITSPAVRLLSFSTEALLRLFRVRQSTEAAVTEEEIKFMLHQGAQAGTFEKAEREMVEGVFRLGDKRVGALMTPRKEIIWLDIDESPEETHIKITNGIYSRFPVVHGGIDKILGIVQAKDLLDRSLSGQTLDLKASLQHALFVPGTMPALKALEMFKKQRKHIALVVDEYGGLQGLITIHDILEAIVGDIPIADANGEHQAVERQDGSWLLDGMLSTDRVKEILSIESLPEEEKGYYQTLGGFVITHLGNLPQTGDHFEWNGTHFEVIDMDGHRVDKVLVVPNRQRLNTSANNT